jgi:hypothetical protein
MSQNVFYASVQAIDKLNSDQFGQDAQRNDRLEGRLAPPSPTPKLLGERELSDELGVPPSRHKAFHKSLKRLRSQQKIMCWKELEKRKGNSATFT